MRIFLLALLFLACPAIAAPTGTPPQADLVRVYKSAHTLQLLSGGKVLREFHIALGGDPKGHKQREGDQRTPEGVYALDDKKADTRYHRAIHISYPNAADIAAAKARGVSPGGAVMIHGQRDGTGWLSFLTQRINWTNGCVALANADMDVVWDMVSTGTRIEIFP